MGKQVRGSTKSCGIQAILIAESNNKMSFDELSLLSKKLYKMNTEQVEQYFKKGYTMKNGRVFKK
jgi:hypothetical protein